MVHSTWHKRHYFIAKGDNPSVKCEQGCRLSEHKYEHIGCYWTPMSWQASPASTDPFDYCVFIVAHWVVSFPWALTESVPTSRVLISSSVKTVP